MSVIKALCRLLRITETGIEPYKGTGLILIMVLSAIPPINAFATAIKLA